MGAHIHAHSGITLAQVQAWLLTKHGVELSTGQLGMLFDGLGLSFKKLCKRPSKQDRRRNPK
jgi:transposase